MNSSFFKESIGKAAAYFWKYKNHEQTYHLEISQKEDKYNFEKEKNDGRIVYTTIFNFKISK